MKTHITLLLLLVGFSSFAMPNPTSKETKKATVSTRNAVESNPALSAKQLQEENIQLRMQLSNLLNENEELKGSLAFQATMQKMLAHVNNAQQAEANEEMNALTSYHATMSKTLKALQTVNQK